MPDSDTKFPVCRIMNTFVGRVERDQGCFRECLWCVHFLGACFNEGSLPSGMTLVMAGGTSCPMNYIGKTLLTTFSRGSGYTPNQTSRIASATRTQLLPMGWRSARGAFSGIRLYSITTTLR
jgi:hypothetical protein